MISGLYFPRAAIFAGYVNVIAKPLYSRGYYKYGPNGRLMGAKLGGFTLYALGFATIGKIMLDLIL